MVKRKSSKVLALIVSIVMIFGLLPAAMAYADDTAIVNAVEENAIQTVEVEEVNEAVESVVEEAAVVEEVVEEVSNEEDPFAEVVEDEVVKEDDENLAEANAVEITYKTPTSGGWQTAASLQAAFDALDANAGATENIVKVDGACSLSTTVRVANKSFTLNGVPGSTDWYDENMSYLYARNDFEGTDGLLYIDNRNNPGAKVIVNNMRFSSVRIEEQQSGEPVDRGTGVRILFSPSDAEAEATFTRCAFRRFYTVARSAIGKSSCLEVRNGTLTMNDLKVYDTNCENALGNSDNASYARGTITHVSTDGNYRCPTTITNAAFLDCYADYGGAIFTNGGPLTLKDINANRCFANYDGGFLYAINRVASTNDNFATATFSNLRIMNCASGYAQVTNQVHNEGGGLYICRYNVYIDRTSTGDPEWQFYDCYAHKGAGGAMYVRDCPEIFVKNIKINGCAAGNGGAIYVSGSGDIQGSTTVHSRLILQDCKDITKNLADNGGALFIEGEAIAEIRRCVFTENEALESSGAIRCNGQLVVSDTNFIRNKAYDRNGGAISFIAASGSQSWADLFVVERCKFDRNSCTARGGAIAITGEANATIKDTDFLNNNNSGKAEDYVGAYGGAIYYANQTGNDSRLSIMDSNFIGNKVQKVQWTDETNNSYGYGGAIFTNGANASLSVSGNCTFDNNVTDGPGGAIDASGGELSIYSAKFTNNKALWGGAIRAYSNSTTKTLVIDGATFNSNQAANTGGAIHLDENGGAVNLTLNNSVFTQNKALNGDGGAIKVSRGGTIKVNGLTVTGNTATTRGGGLSMASGILRLQGGSVVIAENTPGNLSLGKLDGGEAAIMIVDSPIDVGSRIGLSRTYVAKEQPNGGFGTTQSSGSAFQKIAKCFTADNNATLIGSLANNSTSLVWALNNAEIIPINVGTFKNAQKTSVSPTEAVAGETVTVTVTPNSGYVLNPSSVKVTDGNGKVVSHTIDGNKITFVVPANGPVSVNGECTLVPNPSGRLQNRTNGAVDAAMNGSNGEIVVLTKNNRQIGRVYSVSGSTYTRMNINWTHSGNRHTGTIPNFNPNGTYVIALKGDINFDGRVVASDAQQTARQAVTGLRTPFNDLQRKIADTAGTGETVDISDAQQIARWAVGLSANGFTW